MKVPVGVLFVVWGSFFCVRSMCVSVVDSDKRIDLNRIEEFSGVPIKKLIGRGSPYALSALATCDAGECFVDTQRLLHELDGGSAFLEGSLQERMVHVVASYRVERKKAEVDAAMTALLNCRLARYYQRSAHDVIRARMYPCLQTAFAFRDALTEADQRFVCGHLAEWLISHATDGWNTPQTRAALEGLCAVAHESDGEHAVRLRFLLAQVCINADTQESLIKARALLEQAEPQARLLTKAEQLRVRALLGVCYSSGIGGSQRPDQARRLLFHSFIDGLGMLVAQLKDRLPARDVAMSAGQDVRSAGGSDADTADLPSTALPQGASGAESSK